MGTDYAARKLAKKQWKKAGGASQADGKGRDRAKKGAKRRLCQVKLGFCRPFHDGRIVMFQRYPRGCSSYSRCHPFMQGMCYSEPMLTGEDKAWSDGPSDHYDSDVEEPQKGFTNAVVGSTSPTHQDSHLTKLIF